jgi:hypothetical protein
MNILSIVLFFSALICARLFQILLVNPKQILMTPIRTFLPATPLLAMLTCFFACSPPKEDKPVSTTTAGIVAAAPDSAFDCPINGQLPVLWIEASEFLKLRGQPAFRFYVDNNKDLTLGAWSSPYNDQLPVFTLKTSILSTVSVSSGNYLGNLILKARDRADIERRINSEGWTIVKFVPILGTGANETGQVSYYIVLTNGSMPPHPSGPGDSLFLMRDTSSVIQPGGYELNPSPPRNE